MINTAKSRWVGVDSWAGQELYSLAPATIQEGAALCYINEGGIGKATQIASPAGTDVFMGLAYNYYNTPDRLIMVETFTVPASGSYVVTLSRTPIAGDTDMLVKDSAGQVYAFDSTPDGDDYNLATRTVTFFSTAAGKVVTFTYAYTPLATDLLYYFGSGLPGGVSPSAVTGTIGLIRRGIVFTSCFDPLVDWATNPATMKVGANGLIATAGSGPIIPGYVTEAPSSDTPYLGIFFDAHPIGS